MAQIPTVKWGETKDETKRRENNIPIHESDNQYIYEKTIAGITFEMIYDYDDSGRLAGVGYMKKENVMAGDDMINKYFILTAHITKHHGNPVNETAIWSVDRYKNKKEYWGIALGLEHVKFITAYQDKEGNRIMVMLQGMDGQIVLGIMLDKA